MKIYNTLTREVSEFVPRDGKNVSFYTCGPTVYHDQHIGNMRNYIGHDILDKTLRFLGYNVTRVMNITDVGHLSSDSDSGFDKMVWSAKEKKKSVMDIADYYTKQFFDDFKALNNRVPDIVAPATDYINDYIKIISGLIDKGFAYFSGGNVYFDTSLLDDYYKLTNHKEDSMVVGVRSGVLADSNKKNQADFVLWFTKSKFDDQELKWDSPWGLGYPGWHIECSGICMHYLGEYVDIHGGGVDNIFPHHTNEIAQSEAFLGHPWCNYWFHNEHLMDETGKMSKSKGAILTVSLLKEKGYDPLAFRFMCLMSHYRKQLVFSYSSLDVAARSYSKLREKTSSLVSSGELMGDKFDEYKKRFSLCLENDLNTANGITVLYDLLKDKDVNNCTKISLIKCFDEVLSLDLLSPVVREFSLDDDYIKSEIERRNEAKNNKDYILADSIRDSLKEKGVLLVDTKEGTTYKII